MRLAETARGRDAAVAHLQNALKHRPGHPDNLAVEFRIGILLSQGYEPEGPRPWRREEGAVVFRHILQTYRHMDYYSKEPVSSSSDMQFMIPEAAVGQYRYRFGRLGPTDAAIPMGRIVRDFPDTPMARIAQQRIDRIRRLFPELDLEKLLDSSVPESPES